MSKEIKNIANKFEAFQRDIIGYVRYKIRSEKVGKNTEYCVDAYTSTGTLIKTALCCATENRLIEFIDAKKKALQGCYGGF